MWTTPRPPVKNRSATLLLIAIAASLNKAIVKEVRQHIAMEV